MIGSSWVAEEGGFPQEKDENYRSARAVFLPDGDVAALSRSNQQVSIFETASTTQNPDSAPSLS
jgi:hypothetical protein